MMKENICKERGASNGFKYGFFLLDASNVIGLHCIYGMHQMTLYLKSLTCLMYF